MSSTKTAIPAAIPLGQSVPPLTAHAISVSLPKWADNVDYEEGAKRVVDKMETGYPRFFIHRSIQKLASLCLAKFGRIDELCLLLPSARVAGEGRDFLAAQNPAIPSRIVEFVVCPSTTVLPNSPPTSPTASSSKSGVDIVELQILLFDKAHWGTAKAFWQHTGDGICSRMAERALSFMGEVPAGATTPPPETTFKQASFSRNRHYARRTSGGSTPRTPITASNVPMVGSPPSDSAMVIEDEQLSSEFTTYLEERYGRNMPLFSAPLAKQALKRRIAGGLVTGDEDFGMGKDVSRGAAIGSSLKAIAEDDVYLYPGGMSAIWHAHDICRRARRAKREKEGKSLCYGFPYTDTLKILSKWGPGCHFFGSGGTNDIPALESLLASESPDDGQILALFCEFPSNPLLTSPDLVRIRQLADQYGFVVVIDETIGNFINVEVAAFADIVVSSLTKIFSGDANVMGGSLILNPNSQHYEPLKAVLQEVYEDLYYPEDAVYMERNSRDYRNRIRRVNDNAYDVCEYLYSRSMDAGMSKAIKKVYYPRYITPEEYDRAKRIPTLGQGGYGGLFSLTFTSFEASRAFYDALGCAKGPSLGTSFTLASPYTILAHYLELDWAAQYGVEAGLVRISVGQEDREAVLKWFEDAVKAAETVV